MATKAVFDIKMYKIGDANSISLEVEIKFSQNANSNLYKNGTIIKSGVVNNFNSDISVKVGDKIKLVTTVSDISQQTDNTGVDITLTGGAEPLNDPHDQVADSGDLVTYDLTYYII